MTRTTNNNKDAGNQQTPYRIFNQFKENIESLKNIQLNIIYDSIHNGTKIDWDEKIRSAKNDSEVILYFLGKHGIELRTLNYKDEKNIGAMYISKKDGRVRLRKINSNTSKRLKDSIKTLARCVTFIENSKLSPEGFNRVYGDNTGNYHAHHINGNKTIDEPDNTKLLYKKKHYQIHKKD